MRWPVRSGVSLLLVTLVAVSMPTAQAGPLDGSCRVDLSEPTNPGLYGDCIPDLVTMPEPTGLAHDRGCTVDLSDPTNPGVYGDCIPDFVTLPNPPTPTADGACVGTGVFPPYAQVDPSCLHPLINDIRRVIDQAPIPPPPL